MKRTKEIFTKWFKKKFVLNNIADAPHVKVGDVWLCNIGINIGIEIDSSHDTLLRPVIVTHIFNEEHIIIIPLTKTRKDSRFYHKTNVRNIEGSANITQIRAISSKRLLKKVDSITKDELAEIIKKLKKIL